jgi:hypothetical protein
MDECAWSLVVMRIRNSLCDSCWLWVLRFADRFAKLEKAGAVPVFRREVQSQVNQRSFLGELSLYDRARRIVPGTRFALYQKCWGGVMVNETELFYLVMLILLTLIIHLVLMMTGPRRDGMAHR